MPEVFGSMPDGTTIRRFWLANGAIRTAVLEIGAAIQVIEVPDRNGRCQNVVLGMATLEDYRLRSPHFGAVPGRTAGRIAGGRFTLDGVPYQLLRNDGGNTLHGGIEGFGRLAWTAVDYGPTHVTLRLVSPDGDQGYPGEVETVLTYRLQDDGLHMHVEARTTKPTILNLTNHSYFNLAGEGTGAILDHKLRIDADVMLPVDANSLSTGEQRQVDETPFDFRTPQRIGDRIRDADPQLRLGLGYDHFYNVRGTGLRSAAVLSEPTSGRTLTLLTTAPGLQLYTANKLNGSLVGLSGRRYRQSDAVCLEAQHPSDSPNHPAFPSIVLRPNDAYRLHTIFRFETTPAPP